MSGRRLWVALVIVLLGLVAPMGVTHAAGATSTTASSLSVSIVPPTLPADGQTHGVVVVSLLDQKGAPTVALNDTVVYLTSSQEDVATVQNLALIPAGHSYIIANATMTLTAGTTTITAASVGLHSGYGALRTMAPSGFPTSLAVFSAPPVQPLGPSQGQLVVEVLDQVGHPTRAASPTRILLTSSNNSVAKPSVSSFTLQVNATVAVVGYSADQLRPAPGSATITATATGFNAGYSQITVSNSTDTVPVALSVQANPAELLADGRSYGALTVMLRDVNGSPTQAPPASAGVYVQLTSSQPSVLNVPSVVVIPSGKSYVLVNATSTTSPGSSTITATSTGLASSSTPMDTVAPAPSKLALYVAPPEAVVTGKGSVAMLFVQLQDGGGNPALGRRATSIVITSSNITLAGSAQKVSIPRGSDYGVVPLFLNGSSNGILTAVSSGLRSSNASLSSVRAPFQAQASASAYTIYPNETTRITVSASALGNPVQGALVTWNSSSGSFASGAGSTNSKGVATAVFQPSSPGEAKITATIDSRAMGAADLTVLVYVAPIPPHHDPTLLERILSYWLYIAIGGAAGAAAALVFLVRRRRKSGGASSSEDGFELAS